METRRLIIIVLILAFLFICLRGGCGPCHPIPYYYGPKGWGYYGFYRPHYRHGSTHRMIWWTWGWRWRRPWYRHHGLYRRSYRMRSRGFGYSRSHRGGYRKSFGSSFRGGSRGFGK
jgi:hypothetical protein